MLFSTCAPAAGAYVFVRLDSGFLGFKAVTNHPHATMGPYVAWCACVLTQCLFLLGEHCHAAAWAHAAGMYVLCGCNDVVVGSQR